MNKYFILNFKKLSIEKLFDFLEIAYKNHDEKYISCIRKELIMRGAL